MFGMFPELTDIMESDTDETSCIESITYLGPIYYILLRSQKKHFKICPHRKVVRVVGL